MLQFLRFSLTGLILLIAAPALALPVYSTETVARGTNGITNVFNDVNIGTTSISSSGSGSASGATLSSSAQATASFLHFGGSASSSLTNFAAAGSRSVVGTARSVMSDSITITSAGIADGTQGFLQYVFSLEGTLSVTNTTSTLVSASALVTITHDLGGLGGWQQEWKQSAAGNQTINESAVISPLIAFIYGTPFDLHFRLTTSSGTVSTPSHNFTADAEFLNTLTVQELNVFDANEDAVTDASIMGDGGTQYPGSVPEPRALLLLALAGLALRRARKQR